MRPGEPMYLVDRNGTLLVLADTPAEAEAGEAAVRLGADILPVAYMKIATDADRTALAVRLIWDHDRDDDAVRWAYFALAARVGVAVRFIDEAWTLCDVEHQQAGVLRLALLP